MTFHVGQKVVCVDDGRRVSMRRKVWFGFLYPWVRLDHNLNRGDVYTITNLRLFIDEATREHVTTLYVDGARHFERGPRDFEREDPGFPAFQFRPVVKRKTDISIFKRLLQPGDRTTSPKWKKLPELT